jgi:phosphoribosyl-dephospho-CoA transferase
VADALARHDLVRVDPAAWARLLAAHPDLAASPCLADWAAAGRPLIVRRYAPGEPREGIPLGLPLPPAHGKRRIGVLLPASDLSPVTPPALADTAGHVPAAWHPTLDALVALGRRHGAVPRPFGGLLWQAMTGLPYLTAGSDLDLLWPCPAPVPPALLDGLDAIARDAPMRLDGEILLPDGGGVHWRELREAPEGGTVLVKRVGGLELRPVASFRPRAAA